MAARSSGTKKIGGGRVTVTVVHRNSGLSRCCFFGCGMVDFGLEAGSSWWGSGMMICWLVALWASKEQMAALYSAVGWGEVYIGAGV